MIGKAVIVSDGILETESDLTPQQFLLAHGDGVYTSALLTSEEAVVDWELHKQRLIRGMEVINQGESKPFEPLLAALKFKGDSLSGFVSSHVTPAAKSALDAFYGAATGNSGGGNGGAAAAAAGPQPPRPHAMLVIAVCPHRPPPAQAQAHAHAPTPSTAAEQQPCTGCAATGQAQQPTPPQLPPPSLVPAARVAVYCKAVQPPPYGPGHAGQAAVMGRPRSLAAAKACSWVAERRRLEAAKPPDAAEVLLSDSGGGVLEGLVTNFHVVVAAAAGAGTPAASAAPEAPSPPQLAPPAAVQAGAPAGPDFRGLALQVCAPDSGAALPGVAQCRLLQAAAALRLRVELRPPRAAERAAWREAFLTNCIRRVQPLSRVFCPPGNEWGFEPWEWAPPLPPGPQAPAAGPGPGPVTAALREQLLRLEEHTPWQELR